MKPPCSSCVHLMRSKHDAYGVRCVKGDTSDMNGDFSCYQWNETRSLGKGVFTILVVVPLVFYLLFLIGAGLYWTL